MMSSALPQSQDAAGQQSLKKIVWEAYDPPGSFVQQLCQHTGITPFLSSLVSRHAHTLEGGKTFLNPSLQHNLPSPYDLPDIDKATHRICEAILKKEKIALWGDYDVDGATSVSIWMRFLKACNIPVRVYIPDRFREGYGPNAQGIHTLAKEGVTLIITLDCGTAAFKALDAAQKKGVDVVIVDHHVPDALLPPACAVVNPKRKDTSEKGQNMAILAAVGVSFFCLIALRNALKDKGFYTHHTMPDLRLMLDLVALGTVCDVVPLQGVNRLLVHKGLHIMNQCASQGLSTLIKQANLAHITSHHLGFVLGPRLNAGSRMAQSDLASRLLSTESPEEAQTLAEQLSTLNMTRKSVEQAVTQEALEQAKPQRHHPIIVVHSHTWHEGVIGIVASRLKDAYQKPVFVITFNTQGGGKGSGRSLPHCDLGHLIQQAASQNLIEQGGGHKMAGGISLTADQLASFQAFCLEHAQQTPPPPHTIKTFHSVLTFNSLTLDLWEDLKRLEPFGADNPKPVFLFEHVRLIYQKTFGTHHQQYEFAQQDNARATSLIFNAQKSSFWPFFKEKPTTPFHILASPTLDTWRQKVILELEDIVKLS